METSPAPSLPQRRGWWSRNWKWFVPTGCLTALVVFCAFIGVIIFGVFAMMKSTSSYRDALARAKNDPRVIAALGQPIKEGFWISGSSDGNFGGLEKSNLVIPISGPKASAKIYAISTRTGSKRTYSTLAVEVQKNGERIDLTSPRGIPHNE